MKSPNILYTIEFARGMACLAVLALHVILFGQDRYLLDMQGAMPFTPFLMGGVDLFFIISGFLMVHTTRDASARRAKDFLLKRFIRIYPAYWLVLLCILPVFFFKPEWAFFGNGEKPSLILSFLLLPQQSPPILAVAWTLVFEVYFYLLFAATLFLKPKVQFIALAVFFLSCIAIGLLSAPDSHVLKFFTSDLLAEFLCGMGLALLWPHFPKLKIMMLLFTLFFAAYIWIHPLSGLSRFMDQSIPALLLFITLLFIEKNNLMRAQKLSLFLGGISYTLYLIHVPIIAGLPKLLPLTGFTMPPVILMALAVTAAITAGTLLHYQFEIPVQKKIKNILLNRSFK